MKPYTYLLHHKPTNTYYYGVRWRRGCCPEEFWIKYFTSSDTIQLLRTLFGDDSFEFEIRKVFETGKEAAKWETKVLRRMKVLDNQNIWLNRTTNSAWLYEINPNKGKPNPRTQERNKLNNPTWNKNISKEEHPMFGRHHSDETKKRQSDFQIGQIKPKVTCINCRKTGGVPVMQRFHMDNCSIDI